MARNTNLRLKITNQLMEDIATRRLNGTLPSQASLASLYNVSRTTIRASIDYLINIGILREDNSVITIIKLPSDKDIIPYIQTNRTNEKNLEKFESYLYIAFQKKEIIPGDELSELDLAQSAKVDIQTVREYFMQFSRFHLIKNLTHGKWKLIKFNQHYADKLFEIREMLERHALECFMRLPHQDIRWTKIKYLQKEHLELRSSIVEQFADFAILDHKLHSLILSAADNPFISDFIDLISVIFHFHYQWDNTNLRTRNILAIEEHLSLLNKIIQNDKEGAIKELHQHLQTAKKTLTNGIIG